VDGPDLGLLRSFLEADAPRVTCREHGVVVVASVPWAGHGARHPGVRGHGGVDGDQDFQVDPAGAAADRLAKPSGRSSPGSSLKASRPAIRSRGCAGSRIDEISYKKGHRYITIMVGHDTGQGSMPRTGRSKAVLELTDEERYQLRRWARRAWLAAHPRFHIHYMPTYSSWINQVERCFAYLTLHRRGDSRVPRTTSQPHDDF
jgi:hypothetical protein